MIKQQVILASASPRRRELLKKLFPSFKVIPSSIDESTVKASNPAKLAVATALAKAQAIAGKQKNAIIIGADTLIVFGKTILGKPKSKKDAYLMLKSLSGKTHRVITGLAVINTATKKTATTFEVTTVKMKEIADQDIIEYVKSGHPLDKSGGYGIQEIEDVFIKQISGDYDNVVGLPIGTLQKLLRRLK